ncbi:MAG: hypothetical protein ACKVQB_12410 [Bacteroidia bacterium]
MKTHVKTILTIGFLTLFLVNACKEKEEDKKPEPENTIATMFKAHSWRINDVLFLKKGSMFLHNGVPKCLLDDKLDFLIGDLYVKDPKIELCSGQIQKKDTLGWKLINNNKQLEINNKGTIVINDIFRVSADSLMTSLVSPNGDTLVYLYLKY